MAYTSYILGMVDMLWVVAFNVQTLQTAVFYTTL